GLVYGLEADGILVKGEPGSGAACKAKAEFVHVSTTLFPMRCRLSGMAVGATELVAVTAAKERPALISSTRIVAPRPDPWRNSNKDTFAGFCGSVAVTLASVSAAGLSQRVVVALSTLYLVTTV